MAAIANRPPPDLSRRVGDFLVARAATTDRICVGLSGGCDSVVLLYALHAWRRRQASALPILAVHVHHGLSPNADGWANFCQAFCAQLEIPLTIRRVQVAPHGEGLEAAARTARYQAFAEVLGDSATSSLLLAQHRGDQAETVLFNLLRGAGVTGLAGIPLERTFASGRILRPLLGAGRAEIEAYAEAHGLRWVEDESNRDTRFSRNFLRHEALTVLAQRFPAAEQSLARAAGHLAEAGELLDELAVLDWAAVADGEAASWAALRCLSLPRLKNLLRFRLRQLGWQSPVAERLDEFARQLLTAAPDRHPALDLPSGTMRAGRGRLHWLSR